MLAVSPSMPVRKIEEEHQVRISVRCDGAYFYPHASLVANRDTNHRPAIDRRCFDLVRRFEVRIEPAISVHARVQEQANIVPVRQDAIKESQPSRAKLFLTFGIPEQVVPVLVMETLVCMPFPFTPTTGLGRKEAVKPIFVAT